MTPEELSDLVQDLQKHTAASRLNHAECLALLAHLSGKGLVPSVNAVAVA